GAEHPRGRGSCTGRPTGKRGGTYSPPMPVTGTYRRPCKQAWLLAGGRPSPAQTTGGRIGSKIAQTDSGNRRANDASRMAVPSETTDIVPSGRATLKSFFR